MKIVIIGQGNVACNLSAAFLRAGLQAPMYSSREGLNALPREADVYIYAVRDEALQDVIAQVHVQARALHLHTSGTMPLSVFGPDKLHCGVMYPFQTFTKTRLIEDFSTIPIFIEAAGIDDISAVYSLALSLTSHIYETTIRDRERLHLAGVLANNFTNHLFAMAEEILRGTHIPFSALLPLIDETAAKVHTLPPHEAQTGPARRHDHAVMEHHLSLLPDDHTRELYRLMSQDIEQQY